MSFIRTVLGDINPDELGVCDSHDHLIRSGGEEVRESKNFLMDSVNAAVSEFLDYVSAGGKSMVCMDPLGCGRNVPKMLEVAEKVRGSGHILMTTGFHKAAFYDTKISFLATVDPEKIADWCALEITEGMDKHSYNGPVVERTGAKAGLVKAGTGYASIHPFERKGLMVAAFTQQRTGCPIATHTQLGTMGPETVRILKEYGGDVEHMIISHLQKNPDKYEHKRVLDTGATICYDGPDRVKYFPDSLLAETIKWLVDKGHQKQILLSMDSGRVEYQKGYMAEQNRGEVRGIAWLLSGFVPLLREVGVGQDAIDDMLINNPKRVFAFKK